MQVELRKTSGPPEIRIARDDGVILVLRSPDRKFPVPHDMVHFVVEQTLGLDRGFWGTLAEGALFPSVRVTGGRQRPHARERSKALLKSNAHSLSEAEVIVGAFQHAMLENSMAYRTRIQRALSVTGRDFNTAAIERTWATLAALRQRWESLDPGECIRLHWSLAEPGRPTPRGRREHSVSHVR